MNAKIKIPNGLRKSDLYNFIQKKHKIVYSEKVKPLNDAVEKLQEAYIAEILQKCGYFEIGVVDIGSKELIRIYSEIRDQLSWRSSIARLVDDLSYFQDSSRIKEHIWSSINWKNVPEVDSAIWKKDELVSAIGDEFRKIKAAVKSFPTAKKGFEFLAELGFDVSELEPEIKNELKSINVNSRLLGLPEKEG